MGRCKVAILLLAFFALTSCRTAQQTPSPTRPSSAVLAPKPIPPKPSATVVPAATAPSAARVVPAPPPSPNSAEISSVINQAEDDYTAGLDDYQSGDMERAKEEFDNALSVLLESKVGVLGDNRLTEEFDLLTDNINQVELAAIQQGNSLSAHQYVPTPIESFAGLTFPPNASVMQQMRQEMLSIHSDIPLVTNQSVSGAIAYLTQHARGYITSVLEGLAKYGPMITQTLQQDGLPHDLVYLPGPESAYKPHAESRKGARGIWQLMAGTAELYGLRVNDMVDDREDPYRSTAVAARNLKDLYHEFGDWYLALAAYDSGPGTVERAIQNTGYADFWTLRKLHAFPSSETDNYVPIFLATALIAKDPEAYGFNIKSGPPLEEDHVAVSTPVDLRLVANLLDCSADELAELNPGLRTWVTPADDPGFMLSLPRGTQALFEQRIAAVPPSERRWWRARKIQSGDTLRSVAAYYRISPSRLAEANHLSLEDRLGDGSYLLIPLAPSVEITRGVRWVRRAVRYRIRRGDNLDLIADRYDVTAYQIRRWNRLGSSHLVAGRTLLIYRLVPVHYRTAHPRYVRRRRVAQHDPKELKKTQPTGVAHASVTSSQ